MTGSYYARHLALLEQIERRFPVSEWRSGDLDIWPLARLDLYLDMYWAEAGVPAPRPRPLPLRVAARCATPLRNRWKTRRDRSNYVARPARAHAILLGDGVSLDRQDGRWRDRFGEPVIAALERCGHDTLLMQGGDLGRLPWTRPTFAANIIESRGFLRALVSRRTCELPGHEGLLTFLSDHSVNAPSLDRLALERRANLVAATAASFEPLLRRVEPTVAFVVNHFAGLGPAFVLACRRLGVLSVDLQRSPQSAALHAYHWKAIPPRGYATLPAVFWTWTKEEAFRVDEWSGALDGPWHRAIHGGHTQLHPFLDDQHPATRAWEARIASIGAGQTFAREVLVALQPVHGHRNVWRSLCSQIEASPRNWRWWIRRHPASRPEQDREAARLLALRRPNVVNADTSMLPLPALLRRMSVVVSLASGAAVEASMFGVPALFLLDSARHSFPDLIARGAAAVVEVGSVNSIIARLAPASGRAPAETPAMDEVLLRLEQYARDYRHACESRRR